MKERGIVFESFFRAGMAPVRGIRVSMEAAVDRIPQRAQALERERDHVRQIGIVRERKRKQQRVRVRKFRRRAEAAVDGIEAIDEKRAEVIARGERITVRLSAVARSIPASFGETRRSLGGGGKPDTTYCRVRVRRPCAASRSSASALRYVPPLRMAPELVRNTVVGQPPRL